MSFTLALNSRKDGEFDGGGTWFEALGPRGVVVDAEVGHACAFAGPLRHAGYPISRGTRFILVLFCYVEGFPYSEFVQAYEAEHGSDCEKAAAAAGPQLSEEELTKLEKGREKLLREARYVPAGWATHYSTRTDSPPDVSERVEGKEGEEEKKEVCCEGGGSGHVRPSGDAEGGYVIYQQTTALVNMLNREVVSVLD